jgi:hypothetical protein
VGFPVDIKIPDRSAFWFLIRSTSVGLLMTFADAGVGRVDVTGPVGLTHYLASTRLYAFRYVLYFFDVSFVS